MAAYLQGATQRKLQGVAAGNNCRPVQACTTLESQVSLQSRHISITQAAHLGEAGLPDEDGGVGSGRAQEHAIRVELSRGVPCLHSIIRHLRPAPARISTLAHEVP